MNFKLKNRRKELGLTLKDVADKVGVSTATVSRWETGSISNMRKDKINALASVLKVEPSFIIDSAEYNQDLTLYSNKTFEEFLDELEYEEELNVSLILNKNEDDTINKDEIEVVKIPKNAYKKLLEVFKTLKK